MAQEVEKAAGLGDGGDVLWVVLISKGTNSKV